MRSTGIVLSGALALSIVAFASWMLSQEQCSSPSDREQARDIESRVAAAKSAAVLSESREQSDIDAARERCSMPDGIDGSIRVRVCDETGAPVAGARVGFLKPAEPDDDGVAASPLEFVEGTTVATDSSGGCALFLFGAGTSVDVAATAAGFAPGFWSRARSGDELLFELHPAAEVTGFVRDRAGAPVAGATIRWHCSGPRRASGGTKSAADGSYRLVDVVEIRSRLEWNDEFFPTIEVDAEGFAPLRFKCDRQATRSDARHWQLDLWLLRGGRLCGRIVDRTTRAPIAGADVFLRSRRWSPPAPPMRTKSGADGRFVLDRVPPIGLQNPYCSRGEWSEKQLGDLCVVAAGHGGAAEPVEAPDDGEEFVRDFELSPACDVRGRIVDELGAPLDGATVRLESVSAAQRRERFDVDPCLNSDDPAAPIRVDRDGRFALRDVPVLDGPGAKASIRADRYERAGLELEEARLDVAVAAGVLVSAPDLVLRPGAANGRRSVHFVDESGRDVAHASFLTFFCEHDDLERIQCRSGDACRADGTGRAPIHGSGSLPRSEERVWLLVRNEGFASAVVELPKDSIETTIALQPEHRLRGIVRDLDGRPGAAELRVMAQRDVVGVIPLASSEAASSPATGRFLVRGLPAGPWQVTAIGHAAGRSVESVVLQDVEDGGGELEIVLPGSAQPPQGPWWEPGAPSDPAFGRVEVALRFADSGRPVVRADLELRSEQEVKLDARPIAPGRFLFDHVLPGEFALRIEMNDALPATRSVAVVAGATAAVEVEVDPGRTLAGHVQLDQLPASSAKRLISIDTERGTEKRVRVAADGAFVASGLEPERCYRLAFTCFEDDEERRWICADPPRRPGKAAADWRPRFAAAATLIFARGSGEAPPPGSRVRIVDVAGSEVDSYVVTGEEWRIVRYVLPGDYTVQLRVPGGSTREKRVAVTTVRESTVVEFGEE